MGIVIQNDFMFISALFIVGTHLVLDETKMQPGKLDVNGMFWICLEVFILLKCEHF